MSCSLYCRPFTLCRASVQGLFICRHFHICRREIEINKERCRFGDESGSGICLREMQTEERSWYSSVTIVGSGFFVRCEHSEILVIASEETPFKVWCIIAARKVSANFLRDKLLKVARGSFEAAHISLLVIPRAPPLIIINA